MVAIRRTIEIVVVVVSLLILAFPVVNAMVPYSEPRISRIEVQSVPAPGQTAEPSITIAGKVTPIPVEP